ncbi:MAG: ABC-2 family transporter protein, partial [Candidatus Bipolaricaulota bacterium]
VVRYLRFYLGFVREALKTRMADPGDFWIEVVSIILYQGLGLVFLSVIFGHVTELAGWNFSEVLFVFGTFQVVTALFYLFFAWTLWFSDINLLRRRLDVILARPLPPFLQVMAEGAGQSLSEVSGVALGVGILVYATRGLAWQPTVGELAFFVLGLLAGLLILGGLFVTLAMLGFWAKATSSAATPLMEILEFAQYPLSIYSPWLRWVFTFALPIGFVAFWPSTVVLREAGTRWFVPAFLWAVGIWTLALFLWRRGLRRYESAGS